MRFHIRLGLLATLFVMLPSVTSASRVTTAENATFRPNAGIVNAPDVLVSDDPGLPGSLSGARAFSFSIPSDAYVRFSQGSLGTVSVSGFSGIVATGISDDLRTLRFKSSEPLPSGANLTVRGIRLIAYNRYSPLRGFELDVGSDGSVDAYDPNGVRVNQEYGLRDELAPSDPIGLTGACSERSCTLSASAPGDVDFDHFDLSFETGTGFVLSTATVAILSASTYALPLGTSSVRVRGVDAYGNASSGSVFFVSAMSDGTEPSNSASSSDQVSGSGISGSGGSVTEPPLASTGSTDYGVPETLAPPYVPSYRNARLAATIAAMDRFIASKTPTDPAVVRNARNALAAAFEAWYRTRLAPKRTKIFSDIRAQAGVLTSHLR